MPRSLNRRSDVQLRAEGFTKYGRALTPEDASAVARRLLADGYAVAVKRPERRHSYRYIWAKRKEATNG
jgi:hypothetical protein